MEQVLLGQALISLNLITESQLERCVEIQERLAIAKPLGEILLEQGVIDEKTLATILTIQKRRGTPRSTKDQNTDLKARLLGGDLNEYLKVCREVEASDLFLTTSMKPTVRVHGNLIELPVPPLTFEQSKALIFSLLNEEQIERYYRDKFIDLNIGVSGIGRFRTNIFRHFKGIGAVLRTVPDEILPFDELGLPQVVKDLVRFRQGLVLVTGPTGSGKTTTLAALVDLINKTYPLHIVTLEDPIEVIFQSEKSLITQREINKHSDSFATALKAALREDPDVIVVGELRDTETVATALTAAETGHLVFGTLHTRNAHGTILKILNQFPAQKQTQVRTMLASSLRAVISQELVPNIDGNGRSLAHEVMIVNPAVANHIRENRVWQIPMVMQIGRKEGMILLDDTLGELVRQKRITLEEALTRATDKQKFVTVA